MDLILCHQIADFDTLGAAVGLTRLRPGARIVLSGGTHPGVRSFLALHRDELALIERRAVIIDQIRYLAVVDTHRRDRLGQTAAWLDLPQVQEIAVYDHHPDADLDIPATYIQIEPIGSTTTLIVEQLRTWEQTGQIPQMISNYPLLTPVEATVMALGIHVDTGSLTFDHTTARDATALAWLMTQGASLPVIAEYVTPGLSSVAKDLMSSPVRTIRPETKIYEAQKILLRYGHSGLSVVNSAAQLVGIISRRDLDIAFHHGFSHAPVKGYMTTNVKTITPETTLSEIENLMVIYDIGRLPVIENGQLVGIVTRTDVLRQLHQNQTIGNFHQLVSALPAYCPFLPSILELLRDRLTPQLAQLLTVCAQEAEKRGWHVYLVGGAVRDLLLSSSSPVMITDIDLVVDGFHQSNIGTGAGVELAKALQALYPVARLQIHGQFQTAALLWYQDPHLNSLWVDIATARTEFYPYPAANPEVEASSIRQDLYRRDFTINAIAVRLTAPHQGEVLDFFGGLLDLQSRQIRVLHPNSFIEDPTRIYRAVRFAVRLGFAIEPQTEGYIRYCLASGVYERVQSQNGRTPALETRLKSELKYILQAPYWKPALQLLDNLQALRCLHPSLELNHQLWWQIRLLDRALQRFTTVINIESWQIRLEVLIADLALPDRIKVANNLQLPLDSIERLQNLDREETEITLSLPNCHRPSEVFKLLSQFKLPSLILIAVRNSRQIRRQIWRYLTEWKQIQSPLNGHDLQALGYPPGKQFKEILDALLVATLDGAIANSNATSEELRTGALSFLAKKFPVH